MIYLQALIITGIIVFFGVVACGAGVILLKMFGETVVAFLCLFGILFIFVLVACLKDREERGKKNDD